MSLSEGGIEARFMGRSSQPTTSLASVPSCGGMMTRLACARARQAGIELTPILRQAGLNARDVGDENARLSVLSQIKCLELIADELADSNLGFRLARDVDLRQLGFLYYVAASSDVLGDALKRAARYSVIANEGVVLSSEPGKVFRISFKYAGISRHSDRHQIEGFLTALVRVCRQLTGRELRPIAVRLVHRRGQDSDEFDEFLGGKPDYGSDADEVVFSADAAQLPVVSADPYLNKVLVKYCEDALFRPRTKADALRASVENAIVPLLPHGQARIGIVARQLGMSQRTLGRRLSAQGTTFAQILDDLRLALACRYLTEEDLAISRIAWLLGYSEVSAFTHAFQRRAGRTPRTERVRLQRSSAHRAR